MYVFGLALTICHLADYTIISDSMKEFMTYLVVVYPIPLIVKVHNMQQLTHMLLEIHVAPT